MRRELPEHNVQIIAEATNGVELLELLKTQTPDVVLLDLDMPVMDGNEAMKCVNERYPGTKVIIMTLFDDSTLMNDYILRNAKGCIGKTEAVSDIDELISAIRRVHKGGLYINFDREVEVMKLSIRQKEITGLIGDGNTFDEIAKELRLSSSAISKQVPKIMQKIGAKNLAELCHKIAERGFKFFRKPKARFYKK